MSGRDRFLSPTGDRRMGSGRPPPPPPGQRLVLRGIAASPGIAMGRAIVVDRRRLSVPRRHIALPEIEREIERMHAAVSASENELRSVQLRLEEDAAGEHSSILDAHLLILRDEMLLGGARRLIREERLNAEWAIKRTVERIKDLFDRHTDDYFRERRSDVDFVGDRLLLHLTGDRAQLSVDRQSVLIAHDLGPADTAALSRQPIIGVVLDVGSRTSHTAIMARALELPAVVATVDATARIGADDFVIVDGLRGEVVLSPTDDEIERCDDRGRRYVGFARRLLGNKADPSETRDGVLLSLRANLELPAEAAIAMDHGADGVGLYRTEFLYIDRDEPPGEDEQVALYADVLRVVAPREVTLRTFDLGGDKFATAVRTPRPLRRSLGLRGIRLALAHKDLFLTQLVAILRAAVEVPEGRLRVMFPMVASRGELDAAREVFEEARRVVEARGLVPPTVPLGMMVEVPAAAIMAGQLARRCDFFSVGTNDLVQYTLAIDRVNEEMAHLSTPFDPAVLRMLSMTLDAAREAGIPCAICGEAAADPVCVPLLIGLGARELSMNATSVPLVREVVRRVDSVRAREVALRCLDATGSAEVEAMAREAFGPELADVFRDLDEIEA